MLLFPTGMTHAVIPSLLKKGIIGVSVGVNPMTAPPAVPSVFRWRYGNDEIIATWHPGEAGHDTVTKVHHM